jgi:hypothetical protein
MMTQKCWLSRPPGAASLRLEGPVDALGGPSWHPRAFPPPMAAIKPQESRSQARWKPSLG